MSEKDTEKKGHDHSDIGHEEEYINMEKLWVTV